MPKIGPFEGPSDPERSVLQASAKDRHSTVSLPEALAAANSTTRRRVNPDGNGVQFEEPVGSCT